MSFPPSAYAPFRTLETLHPPRATRVIAWILAVGIGFVVTVFALANWVQTAPGTGQVVALDPADRVQTVTALVPGRVERWFITDGQRVRAGDPIARIVDNDPQLLDRLRDERAQVLEEITSAGAAAASQRASVAVARLDVARAQELLRAGLLARRDFELARIKVADGEAKTAEATAKLAEARGKLNRIDVSLARQSAQTVRAPRDGRIAQLATNASGSLIGAGDVLVTLAPETPVRVVELMIDGRDIALVHAGRPVRLEFEGWPAIQISGWPGLSTGYFNGRVRAVDPNAQANGLFRVLVDEVRSTRVRDGRTEALGWPGPEFLRLGAKARGWIQMETVKVGYEVWRQLNDFPLEFRRPAAEEVKTPGATPLPAGSSKVKGGDTGGDGKAK